jgi:hypothetical protein
MGRETVKPTMLFCLAVLLLVGGAAIAIYTAATLRYSDVYSMGFTPKPTYSDNAYYDTSSPYGSATISPIVEKAIENAPEVRRVSLRKLADELGTLEADTLFQLIPNPCIYPEYLDCRGVESPEVKTFVEAALDRLKVNAARREAELTRGIAAEGVLVSSRALIVSVASVLIAFCSMFVAYLGYRKTVRS